MKNRRRKSLSCTSEAISSQKEEIHERNANEQATIGWDKKSGRSNMDLNVGTLEADHSYQLPILQPEDSNAYNNMKEEEGINDNRSTSHPASEESDDDYTYARPEEFVIKRPIAIRAGFRSNSETFVQIQKFSRTN